MPENTGGSGAGTELQRIDRRSTGTSTPQQRTNAAFIGHTDGIAPHSSTRYIPATISTIATEVKPYRKTP